MAYRIVWSPKAIDDADSIALYISRDSAFYAAAVVKKILDTARSLEAFPFAGRESGQCLESFLRRQQRRKRSHEKYRF